MKRNFKDLLVWQKARQLVKSVYQLSQTFPAEERFGLTNQMRRCAVSVPSNIAEGNGRLTPKEFRLFLGHSRGSLLELEMQLILAIDLGFLQENHPILEQVAEVGRLLNGLLNSLTLKD